MPEQVEADRPVPALGQRLAEPRVHAAVQQEAVDEDHDPVAVPVLVVLEPAVLVMEFAHGLRLPTRAPCEPCIYPE